MIKDITIGQYFPGNSVIHRMDARIKIIMTAIFIVMLFAANSVWGLLVGIAFTILTFIISKIPGKLMLKSLKPIVPIIIFTAILNLLFIRTGKAYFEWKFFKITDEGVDTAVFMMIRIICLIVGTSLLTYTTSPIDLTDAIERLLSPLKKIKVPVHELAMILTNCPEIYPYPYRGNRQDNVSPESKRSGYGNRLAHSESQSPYPSADTAFCGVVQTRRGACSCNGVPLLSRRRGQNKNETAPYEHSRSLWLYILRAVPCRRYRHKYSHIGGVL